MFYGVLKCSLSESLNASYDSRNTSTIQLKFCMITNDSSGNVLNGSYSNKSWACSQKILPILILVGTTNEDSLSSIFFFFFKNTSSVPKIYGNTYSELI